MTEKKLSEQNILKRMHHSLGGKTFRAIVLVSLLIGICAMSFGLYLHVASVRRDFRTHTWQMSRTAAVLVDKEEVIREAEEVIRIYVTMSEGDRLQLRDKHASLLEMFDSVRTEGFHKTCSTLRMIQENNGGIASFTAFLDLSTNRRVFITDSDPNDTFCPPGSWDALHQETIDDLMNGRDYFLDSLYDVGKIPATTINMEPYGYRCMAGTLIAVIEGYPVFVFYDTDMNMAVAAIRRFSMIFVVLLVLIIIAVSVFFIRDVRKNVVDPINRLTKAADDYIEDRQDALIDERHFSNLNINTGDEIEELSLAMKAMEADLNNYIEHLTFVTAEREKLATELSLASRIQTAMIPNIYPAFPERREFDIYATNDPAKEIGGDFYDFFLTDDDHLCMLIADVSGKGIPAALFMMASKIILTNNAQSGKTPKQILEDTNKTICKNNPEEMFLTVWIGILEISTGKLVAANAGHEYPMIMHKEGRYEMLKDRHGLVIGGMDDSVYTEYQLQLEAGTRLFVYTDGLPEASDYENNMFRTDRILEVLNQSIDSSPEETLNNMSAAVDKFVRHAEQFDDLTMLAFEYKGAQSE